ncbi:hypothetical protein AB0L17_34020 [Streptomyces cellulosae]
MIRRLIERTPVDSSARTHDAPPFARRRFGHTVRSYSADQALVEGDAQGEDPSAVRLPGP